MSFTLQSCTIFAKSAARRCGLEVAVWIWRCQFDSRHTLTVCGSFDGKLVTDII